MQEWGEFHELVEQLPERQREVFELLWYHELNQEEAAEVLGISSRQVKRIWRDAKLTSAHTTSRRIARLSCSRFRVD